MEQVVTVCTPLKGDVPSIQELLFKSWLKTYPNKEVGITREDIEARFEGRFTPQAHEERWQKMLAGKEKSFVAKEGDKVVGFVLVSSEGEKNQLIAIYVLPEYERKGIGKLLWQHASLSFDPKKKTVVQCATYNKNAIAFYEKLGFKDTGKQWEDEAFRMKSGAILPQLEMEM